MLKSLTTKAKASWKQSINNNVNNKKRKRKLIDSNDNTTKKKQKVISSKRRKLNSKKIDYDLSLERVCIGFVFLL